jgi:hypothetical protein
MRYPTQSEEAMLVAVLAGVADEATRAGVGSAAFHGYEFCATRLTPHRKNLPDRCRVRVVMKQGDEVVCSSIVYVPRIPKH